LRDRAEPVRLPGAGAQGWLSRRARADRARSDAVAEELPGPAVTRDVDQLDGRRDPGRLLDTFVLAQLRGELQLGFPQPRLYHLRDRNGDHKVDLIAELDAHRLIAIEVKATAAPRVDSARHLIWLRDQLGERFVAGVVLHTGPRVFSLAERIIAAPVAALWS
jgi:predicted AAA+ superfamily ATPase